jgi:hypothetical protein
MGCLYRFLLRSLEAVINLVCSKIEQMGLRNIDKKFLNYRENEIHLSIKLKEKTG